MLVLVVEDNRDLGASVLDYLEMKGIECDYAERGDHALQLIKENSYDVLVLDIMMPGLDGLSLCQALRRHGCTSPVIMLTARDTLEDKLAGFEAGADDYLVKPFDLPELEARLIALNKRQSMPAEAGTLKVADLELNLETHQATRQGNLIDLSPACWKILVALMQASPKVLSRETLEKTLWQDSPPDSEALKSHLYTLRKLVDKPYDKSLIHTLRGVGVALREDD
ncbi:response regulator transcription factor [Teredinibacter sp. KSP-S5-2]|uniref:response regulator transcription factor n=1 Tax=Teredinibacter sp. KSP-S5-2 TaxID=3034506 RepID=UPI0029343807|nr:response regulator transcription factor [Teredinibacter sp. KSP-S5-2]WNO10216.1 response regulator transcription factor [Teredinibacter sp. KSP-S5-2]